MITAADAHQVSKFAKSALARQRIVSFAAHMARQFDVAPHIERIAALLEAVERGEIRRLMINLPPRHAKSTLCSMMFPAWFLGRNPTLDVILATHGQELSDRNSRAARDLMRDDRYPFDVQIATDSNSVSRWNTSAGGGCYAVGVGGSVTGRGANILVLDDLQHDSGTELEREATWRWYTEAAVPRLEPGAAVIAIGTRFAEDDIFGRLLASPGGNEWTVLRLSAIAGTDDPMGRKEGEALWPARVPISELEARRVEMGARWFECQFQQNPLPMYRNLFRAAWFSKRYESISNDYESIVCALDSAAKTGVSNDYSVVVTLGVKKGEAHLLNVWRDRVEFPSLLRAVTSIAEHWKPSRFYVEDSSNATALIQQLRVDSMLPIIPVRAVGSKMSRIESITGMIEAGRLLLPVDAPWLNDFEREILSFPNSKHDDQCDALAMALTQSLGTSSFGFGSIPKMRDQGYGFGSGPLGGFSV